ncbi:MAG: oligosaccharide flippase family protein [Candidatus Thermoplasmatota archaeon]|nr:oligosaccharide flippase family protein [Candidatus Thermoplasmatota archaeon]
MELGAEKEYVGVSAIYQFLGNGVQVVSGSLFYIFAARLFLPGDLGVIALFIAIVGLFGIVFTVGLSTAIIHFISSNLNSKVYSPGKILFRILVLGLMLAFAGLIAVYSLSSYISIIFFHSMSDSFYIKLLSAVLFGNILFSILNGAIIGFEKFKASAFISVFIWVIYYFGALFLAFLGHSLVAIIYGWIIGISFGVLIDLIYLLSILAKGYMRKHHGVVGSRSIFVYSIPILLSSIISYGASYTDRFVVAYLLNTYYLGIYNFTLLIFSGIGFIAVPFNNIALPKFSEFYGNDQKSSIKMHVGTSSLILSYFYTPIALGIAALSPIILYYIAGPAYVTGQFALIVVMFIPALFISQNILIQAISSIRKTSFFLYSSLGSLVVNLIFSFLLIPFFGLIGAGIGFSSVYITSFIILYRLAKKEGLVKFNIKSTSKIWISSLIMFTAVYFALHFLIGDFGYAFFILPLLIIFGAFLFFIISYKLKIFSVDEKEFILSIFPDHLRFIKKLIKILVLK